MILVALTLLCQSAEAAPVELEPGMTLRLWQAGHELDRLHEPARGASTNLDELRERLDWTSKEDFAPLEERFVAEVTATLTVEHAGEHAFRLTSDDGSALWLDGELAILNDGLHAARTKEASVDLQSGPHALRVLMFQNAGDVSLSLEWRSPLSEDFEVLDSRRLSTEAGVTRVTAPGEKQLTADVEGFVPGDRVPLEKVHPAWKLETIHPEDWDPMVGCLAWLPDGRLLVGTFEPKNNGVWLEEPNGTLWALSNLEAEDPDDIEVEVFAEGLYHPLGAELVDGSLYVLGRDELTRFADADGDGEWETREAFAAGWTSDNYHHFSFGLEHRDGYLYGTLSTNITFDGADELLEGTPVAMNGPNSPERGSAMRISLADGSVEYFAGGFRTPNGTLVTSKGQFLVGENQGAWMPASKLNHVVDGGFYGYYNATDVKTTLYPDGGAPALFSDTPPRPPAVWLPQDEVANSPTSDYRDSRIVRGGRLRGAALPGRAEAGRDPEGVPRGGRRRAAGRRRALLPGLRGRCQPAALGA